MNNYTTVPSGGNLCTAGPFLFHLLILLIRAVRTSFYVTFSFFFLKKLAKIVLGKTASNGKGPCELCNLCLALAL